MPATDDEAREVARAVREFLAWVHESEHRSRENEVVALIRDHLGESGLEQSVVVRELAPFDHVNLQVALDAWLAASGRHATVRGVTIPPHYGGLSLQQLLHGDGLPPVRLSAPDMVDLPVGPDRTLACLKRALVLVDDPRGRYVLMVRGPDPREDPNLSLEVAGLPTSAAQEVLRELKSLRLQHNVYRGQLLELGPGPLGVTVSFPVLPVTARGDVVLPEPVLQRIERHTMDIAEQRDALRSAGQHLKRGLLLYGPPGTGKTHTTRYLVQQLAGSTIFLLSGRSLHLVGMVTSLARDLQPAVVVLEDVDLVAEDRGHGPESSPVLFELLDAMDGAASDADLLFLLTTNRADLLEPALAARPGRVDVAVEIGLPDAPSRRRLFEVYSRGVPMEVSEPEWDTAVSRTEGVTASFVKELLRRAVVEALSERALSEPVLPELAPAERGAPLERVTGDHLRRALDDLLDSTQSVTRALLGVTADQSGPVAAPVAGLRARAGHGGMGWAMRGRPAPAAYSSSFTVIPDE